MEGLVLLCRQTGIVPFSFLSDLQGRRAFDMLLKRKFVSKEVRYLQFLSYRYVYSTSVSKAHSLFGCLLFWLLPWPLLEQLGWEEKGKGVKE